MVNKFHSQLISNEYSVYVFLIYIYIHIHIQFLQRLVGLGRFFSDQNVQRPFEVCLVLHTSGTTKKPKIVPITWWNSAMVGGWLRRNHGKIMQHIDIVFGWEL